MSTKPTAAPNAMGTDTANTGEQSGRLRTKSNCRVVYDGSVCGYLEKRGNGVYRVSVEGPRDPQKPARRDEELVIEIRRVHADSRQRYGADKVWRQLHFDDVSVARCTVERLLRREGLVGCAGEVSGRPLQNELPSRTSGSLFDNDS